jgi:hypothetical protein
MECWSTGALEDGIMMVLCLVYTEACKLLDKHAYRKVPRSVDINGGKKINRYEAKYFQYPNMFSDVFSNTPLLQYFITPEDSSHGVYRGNHNSD